MIGISAFNVEKEKVLIPEDSIRMRIIANSNSKIDLEAKEKVKNNLEKEVAILLQDTKNTREARNKINENMTLIDKKVKKTLLDNEYDVDYAINFGQNYFPEKEYKGVLYSAGEYESLLVKLGKGEGDNWWCVLFPPLCLIEVEERTNVDEVTYQFFIKKIIDKFLS